MYSIKPWSIPALIDAPYKYIIRHHAAPSRSLLCQAAGLFLHAVRRHHHHHDRQRPLRLDAQTPSSATTMSLPAVPPHQHDFTNPPTRPPGVQVTGVILIVLGAMSLILRLYTHVRLKRHLGLDDLFATTGTVWPLDPRSPLKYFCC